MVMSLSIISLFSLFKLVYFFFFFFFFFENSSLRFFFSFLFPLSPSALCKRKKTSWQTLKPIDENEKDQLGETSSFSLFPLFFSRSFVTFCSFSSKDCDEEKIMRSCICVLTLKVAVCYEQGHQLPSSFLFSSRQTQIFLLNKDDQIDENVF